MTGLCIALASCSNGDYVANPASNGNQSINPLKPLTASEFTWAGADPVSANINGAAWVADSAYIYADSTGTYVIGAIKGKQMLSLYFKHTWTGIVYNMGYHQYDVLGMWLDNTDSMYSATYFYQSALGNSGEMYQVQNDTAVFKGKFYFQAVNGKGQIINFSNGWFNLNKF